MEKAVCVHLIDSLASGGSENLLVNTVNELKEYHHIVLYMGGSNELLGKFECAEIICLNARSKLHFPKAMLKVRKLLFKRKASIVHSHSFWTHVISRLVVPKNVKLLNTYHFADYDTRRNDINVKRMILLDKLTYRKRIVVIAVSNYVRTTLEKSCKFKGEIQVIHNFIGDEYYTGVNRRTIEWARYMPLKIIMVGNIKKEKNYDLVIDASRKIKSKNYSIEIYGGGDQLDGYIKKISLLGINNIIFKGVNNEIETVLGDYHLYMMTSFSEAFPLSPIQAMAANLPMLLSDIPSLRELANEKAIFFKSNDSNSLSAVIEGIIEGNISISISDSQYTGLLKKYEKNTYMRKLRFLYSYKTGNEKISRDHGD